MQNVLDSMRNSDIRAMGYSNIPSRDKRVAYGSYPKSNNSENHDWNATPGPSHLSNGRHGNDDHDYNHDRSNSCTNMTPNKNGNRIMILTTWMIPHPQMALTGHHNRVEMKHPTCTHPLK